MAIRPIAIWCSTFFSFFSRARLQFEDGVAELRRRLTKRGRRHRHRHALVAVVDSGADFSHADLAANLWVNSGEIAGNGKDDDGNGYVDDVNGWDFWNSDKDPSDDYGHGTHVSGTIGGVGGNGAGVAGVNWQVTIISAKFLGATGGSIVDANALLRAYIWHCIAIPLIASIFMGVHFWRVRKDGGISGPSPVMLESEIKEEKGPRPVIMRPSGMQ